MTKLEEIRKSQNLSVYKLAQLSGVSRGTIWKVESGKIDTFNMSYANLFKLASALEINIEDLIDEVAFESFLKNS